MSETDHKATGMMIAAHIASGVMISHTAEMTPDHAAACMKELIVKAIRSHAEAIQQSGWERERLATEPQP